MWYPLRLVSKFVAAVTMVALVSTGASTVWPTVASASTAYAPPALLGPWALSPGSIYAATPAEQAALGDFEAEAVQNTLTDHQLPASDTAAVESWGRNDAESELWALLEQAVQAPNPTPDQQQVVDWLTSSALNQQVAAADSAGLEYAKWAGLGATAYQNLLAGDATEAQLQSFLSSTPVPYGPGNGPTTAGSTSNEGYCTYVAPDPDQSQYTGNIYTAFGQSTVDSDCFVPCQSAAGCSPQPPTYDQFVQWGAADADAVENTQGFSLVTLDVGEDLGFAGAVAGSIATATALTPALIAAVSGTALASAISPFAGFVATTGYAVGASIASASPGTAAYAAGEATIAGTTIAGIFTIAVIGIVVGVLDIINLVRADQLPGQLAALVSQAPADTPNVASMLANQAPSLYALFIGATLPAPDPTKSCDNSLLISVINPVPCLNTTPIPAPTNADPTFTVTQNGSSTSTVTNTISWADTPSQTNNTARISGNWFVDTQSPLSGGTADTFQTLEISYTDWGGNEQDAWVIGNNSSGWKFDTFEETPSFNADTCASEGTCALTSTIDYVGTDGNEYSATLPGAPVTGIPALPSSTGDDIGTSLGLVGLPTDPEVGEPVTLTASISSATLDYAEKPASGVVSFISDVAGQDTTLCANVPVTFIAGSVTQASGGISISEPQDTATCSWDPSVAGPEDLYATYYPTAGTGIYPSQGELTVDPFTFSLALPLTLTLSPAAAAVAAGIAQPYAVTVTDVNGHSINLTGAASLVIGPAKGGSATGASCDATSCSATVAGTYDVVANLVFAGVPLVAGAVLTVEPALFNSIALSPATASVTTGSSQTYTVTGTDEYGNTTDLSGAASLIIGPTSGGSATGASCDASSCSATVPGTYQVVAILSLAGLPLVASAVLTVTGPPASLAATSGGGQSAAAGQPFAAPLVANVADGLGNPVAGTAVLFSVTSGSATFAGGATSVPVTTTAQGVATSPLLFAADAAGPVVITATSVSAPGATAATFSLTVTAGPATAVTAVSGTPQSADAGTAFASALVAEVTDDFGNPVAGVAVTFALPAASPTSGGATFPGGALTAIVTTTSAGVATSPVISAARRPGLVMATASIANAATGTAPTAIFELTVTVPGTARADLAVSMSAPAQATTKSNEQLKVTVTNLGPSPATNVRTFVLVPPGWTVVNAAGGTVNRQVVTLSTPTLAYKANVAYTLTLMTGTKKVRTLLTAGVLSAVRDPDQRNNFVAIFTLVH